MTETPARPSALERLRIHVEAAVANGLAQPERLRWHLTEAEEAVFDLSLRDMPRLEAVFIAWEIAHGSMSGPIGDDRELEPDLHDELPTVQQAKAIFDAGGLQTTAYIGCWTTFADFSHPVARPTPSDAIFPRHQVGHIRYRGSYHGPVGSEATGGQAFRIRRTTLMTNAHSNRPYPA